MAHNDDRYTNKYFNLNLHPSINDDLCNNGIDIQHFLPFASLQGPPAKHQGISILLENWISSSIINFTN